MQNILIIGTVDTKSDEIDYMRNCIISLNCNAILMDVSVLGEPSIKVDYSKHDIAKTVAFLASPASGHTTGTNVMQ